jgi:glycosyltransferase involved in cell wall biosynthesis
MSRLSGVLLSFRRPRALATSLDAIRGAGDALESLIVVDNEAGAETHDVVERASGGPPRIEYVPVERNIGSAAGWNLGIERLLGELSDEDWIVLFDDDDPLPAPEVLGQLHARADALRARDPRMAAVGLRGSRFDRRRGYPVPLAPPPEARHVAADYLHHGFFPCYSVRVIREVGALRSSLFFGWADMELGLRMKAARRNLWVAADLWRASAGAMGPEPEADRPRWALEPTSPRRYYRMRNLFRLLPEYAGWVTTARVFVLAGIAKPLTNLAVDPQLAWEHLRLNVRAALDASRGVEGPRGPPRWVGRPSAIEG